jgi:hypothetical protein
MLLLVVKTFAQTPPDDILIGDKKRPKVLLVGTFHFAHYDQDLYKTDPEKRVDISSPKRQQEILELVDYLSKFKPTKIFVEDFNTNNALMNNFNAYTSGNYQLSVDEIDQIAFRLAKKFDLDTLYAVDEKSMMNDMYNNPKTKAYIEELTEGLDLNANFRDSEIGQKYLEWYEIDDDYLLETTLLDYFKHLNSDEYQNRGYYNEFAGTIGKGSTRVADVLSLGQTSRNMRILHRITSEINSEEDRVLILFGSSHTESFKPFFKASPEHELIEFNELESY